jgi:glutathione S-transferase
MRTLEVASSLAVSVARFGSGRRVTHAKRTPAQYLELYEFEACPYCRKVREALSELDLDVIIRPCPKGGTRFRPGKSKFPYLVDPNTGEAMGESDVIVRYLAITYGDGELPLGLRFGPLTNATSFVGSAFRLGEGRALRPARAPEKLLELWSFEASPYCRLVRETLTTLESPYLLHNIAKGSPKRAAFVERTGRMMVPYLVDPNTGREMFESAEIVRYLEATYGS